MNGPLVSVLKFISFQDTLAYFLQYSCQKSIIQIKEMYL